jgi:hypothetical protein
MITDALNEQKQYSYTVDDRLASITYVNAMNSTPNVHLGQRDCLSKSVRYRQRSAIDLSLICFFKAAMSRRIMGTGGSLLV